MKLKRLIFYAFLIVLIFLFNHCIVSRYQVSYIERIEGLNINMVEVKGGEFVMGYNKAKIVCHPDETPAHLVKLSDFHISQYEITFAQYDLFCEKTGREKPQDHGWGKGGRPVINVNWHDANDFCRWLSEISGHTYRLPTEAEWEYAARGGRKNKGFLYSGSNDLIEVAWFATQNGDQNDKLDTNNKTQLVGRKKPNELGLYDMSGNVWEWCQDRYNRDFYNQSPIDHPFGTGSAPVARGGSWFTTSDYCIATNRDYDSASKKDNDLGFRIVKK